MFIATVPPPTLGSGEVKDRYASPKPLPWYYTNQTAVMFVAVLMIILLLAVGAAWDRAYGHDIYQGLTQNTHCTCSDEERLCESIEAIPVDGKNYYLPASGETIPASIAMPSPDDRFHRCTRPYNRMWRPRGYAPAYPGAQYTPGAPMIERQGPEGWITVPDNRTKDGKPPTLCFWAPVNLF